MLTDGKTPKVALTAWMRKLFVILKCHPSKSQGNPEVIEIAHDLAYPFSAACVRGDAVAIQ